MAHTPDLGLQIAGIRNVIGDSFRSCHGNVKNCPCGPHTAFQLCNNALEIYDLNAALWGAAPELLEALEEFVAVWGNHPATTPDARDRALAAIAKARGKA